MLTLKIVSPEKIEFTGEVESVKVPGTQGNFEILTNHAPIISTLEAGDIRIVLPDSTEQTLRLLRPEKMLSFDTLVTPVSTAR